MEQFWTRQKIRNHCYLRMLSGTDEAANPWPVERLNAAIEEAYGVVLLDADWPRAMFDAIEDIGAQQRVANYPTGAAAGCVEELWIAEAEDDWQRLTESVISAGMHPDLVEAVGGDEWASRCARPRFFQQREQVHVWPATDQAYKLKFRFKPLPYFNDADDTLSAVDGMLIAIKTLEHYLEVQKEFELAAIHNRNYMKRKSLLQGVLNTGQRMPINIHAGWNVGPQAPPQARQEPFPSRTVIDDTGF